MDELKAKELKAMHEPKSKKDDPNAMHKHTHNLVMIAVVLLIAAAAIWFQRYYYFQPHCDLGAIENRLFNTYYGIQSSLFDIASAENMPCTSFYTGHLPLGTLQKTSYIIYGPKGSGKTSVVKCDPSKYEGRWLVTITHDQIREHLKVFAERSGKSNRIADAVGDSWSGDDFAHVLISTMVGKIIESVKKDPAIFENALTGMSSAMKTRLTDILCVYFSSEVTRDLESVVNKILGNSFFSKISPGFTTSIQAADELKDIWDVIKIRPVVFAAKSLLIQAHEQMKTPKYLVDPRDPFSDVVVLCNFVKQVFGLTPAISIDGLDEISDIFSLSQDGHMNALTRFVKAAMAPRLEDMMVTGNIYWMYSFPAENMNYPKLFQSINLRSDKLAIIPIDWPLNSLMDYADSLLDMMRKQQIDSCAVLPDIRTLLCFNGTEDAYMKKLRHPRDMNIFMQELVLQLNRMAKEGRYLATVDDVNKAYAKYETRISFKPFNAQ
jgi:hypothetical protein